MRDDTDFRCYDNGGKTADRYTIVPARKHHNTMMDKRTRLWDGFAANAEPFHPQGIGMSCEVYAPGKHLGKKVPLSTLPKDVQTLARYLFNYEPYQLPLV